MGHPLCSACTTAKKNENKNTPSIDIEEIMSTTITKDRREEGGGLSTEVKLNGTSNTRTQISGLFREVILS